MAVSCLIFWGVSNRNRITEFEVESLFVEFMFNGAMYTVGGIYRHPNGNVSHFVSALECVLHKIYANRTTILAGDINIDIIKFSNEDVVSYVSTLMSFKYLPCITVPSRITQHSTTCIDHMFMKTSKKDKVLNAMSGLFYCEITDHLPCFLSLKFENTNERIRGRWPEFLVSKIVPFLYKRCSPKLEWNL